MQFLLAGDELPSGNGDTRGIGSEYVCVPGYNYQMQTWTQYVGPPSESILGTTFGQEGWEWFRDVQRQVSGETKG